jgi:succinate dehydrogenase hydrophobic anchor subunit
METRQQRDGGWTWLGQAVSGLLLLILLGLHMTAHHFVVEGGLRTYQDVLSYLRNPLIVVLELIFLPVVSFHAMVGLRSVLFDLGLSASQERWVTRLVTALGVAMVIYGVWLTITLVSRV